MLHFLAIIIAVTLLCLALADHDARYLLGQLVKIVLGFGVAALALIVIVVLVISHGH